MNSAALLEELQHSLQMQFAVGSPLANEAPRMSALFGALRPEDALVPTDLGVEDLIASYLLEKYRVKCVRFDTDVVLDFLLVLRRYVEWALPPRAPPAVRLRWSSVGG